MPVIRPIRLEEGPAVRRMILGIAHKMFGWEGSMEANIHRYEQAGYLSDLEDVQASYFARGGLFLVILDGENLVGSGAVRLFDGSTVEVRRLWVLEEYQGRGLGYQLMTQLLDFARQHGYSRARLTTDGRHGRAIDFYKRLGFEEKGMGIEFEDDILMEMDL